eukprot:12389572-Karenia_brevis.AAC.1
MATYVRVLESLADLNDSLEKLEDSKFADKKEDAVLALVSLDSESPKGKTKSKRTKFSQIGAVPLPDSIEQVGEGKQ